MKILLDSACGSYFPKGVSGLSLSLSPVFPIVVPLIPCVNSVNSVDSVDSVDTALFVVAKIRGRPLANDDLKGPASCK